MPDKTTVLVLHGFSQNASIFRKRLGALRKEIEGKVELVFVDAPLVLVPSDVANAYSDPNIAPPARELATHVLMSVDPSEELRGWWRYDRDRTMAIGIEESLLFLRDVLRERRFDGIMGFSQGAALAVLLTALLERPHVYPSFLSDEHAPHPPFKFCVEISGFKVEDPLANIILNESFSTPTLHILGETDVIIVPERTKKLALLSRDCRLEEHKGGHFVPSNGTWRKFLAAYLQNPPALDIPSPNLPDSKAVFNSIAPSKT